MSTAMTMIRAVVLWLALPLVLLVVWWFASAGSTSFYYPPLKTIVAALHKQWLGHRIVDDVIPSLARLLVGYALAVVVGVALGVLVGLHRRIRLAAEPVLEFFRAVPPPVVVPVLLLVVGIGSTTKLVIIASGCIWPILLNTVQGVRGIDSVLTETASCYGLTGWARLRRLVLPAASPQIMTGTRQALSIAIILMVISEMMASTGGLGFTIVKFQRNFAMPEMWSGILVLGLIGIILAMLYRVAERRLLAWYVGMRRLERGEG